MRSLTLSQWRDLRMGVICEDLGALTTARAREFWTCCAIVLRKNNIGIQKLVDRWDKCLNELGRYVEKLNTNV